MKYIFYILLLLAVVLVVASSSRNDGRISPSPEKPEEAEMRLLISRLSFASKKYTRVSGDLIIGQSEADKSIRNEVEAKGRKIVPYLIEGLHSPDKDIRTECATMLSYIPSKDGLTALMACLTAPKGLTPPLFSVQNALQRLCDQPDAIAEGSIVSPSREGLLKIWVPWWKANKDAIFDTEDGISIKSANGTIKALCKLEKNNSTPPRSVRKVIRGESAE